MRITITLELDKCDYTLSLQIRTGSVAPHPHGIVSTVLATTKYSCIGVDMLQKGIFKLNRSQLLN